MAQVSPAGSVSMAFEDGTTREHPWQEDRGPGGGRKATVARAIRCQDRHRQGDRVPARDRRLRCCSFPRPSTCYTGSPWPACSASLAIRPAPGNREPHAHQDCRHTTPAHRVVLRGTRPLAHRTSDVIAQGTGRPRSGHPAGGMSSLRRLRAGRPVQLRPWR